MEEHSKHGKIGRAAMKAGMDRKTARSYLRSGELPSEKKKAVRDYRTRKDPFEAHWEIVEKMLTDAPALESKALFEWLMEQHPDVYEFGQIRTFQRRVKLWRAKEGPEKEVFFGQEHRPGEAMQMDFTYCTELEVTINGELFEHMVCHCVLPYSNWEWGVVCRSESFLALKKGVQRALLRLGYVPEFLQTDSLSVMSPLLLKLSDDSHAC
jgi:hypothetical protein